MLSAPFPAWFSQPSLQIRAVIWAIAEWLQEAERSKMGAKEEGTERIVAAVEERRKMTPERSVWYGISI